jgi:predicted N-formylglutamate amidohydrolase
VSDAYEEVRPDGTSPLLPVCEHASNAVPAEYASLGLPQSELDRHIGYDIGAAALTRALAARLDATALLGVVSRLVIDINREPWHPGFVPAESDGIVVPGNAAVDEAERERRAARWFAPFQARVGAEVDARTAAGGPFVLVTIHSFTPVLADEVREWPVGVLYRRSSDLGQLVLGELRPLVPGAVGDNRPYGIEIDGTDYTVPVHGDDRGVPAIAFEVRHDEIDDEAGVAVWCDRLGTALERTLARVGEAPSAAAR